MSENQEPTPVMNVNLSREGLSLQIAPEMVNQIVLKWLENNPDLAHVIMTGWVMRQQDAQKNIILFDQIQRSKNHQN